MKWRSRYHDCCPVCRRISEAKVGALRAPLALPEQVVSVDSAALKHCGGSSLCFLMMTTILQKTPFEVFFATERYQAMELLKYVTALLLVIAYRLPGMNGIESPPAYDQGISPPDILRSSNETSCERWLAERAKRFSIENIFLFHISN
jgi:hypothetical protein